MGRPRSRAFTVAAIAAGLAVAGSPARADPGPTTEKLSDEHSVTRWAHANTTSTVRAAPRANARAVTRLRYDTEDRRPEVYVALARHIGADGSEWVKVRIPMRPHGKVGWVPRASLGLIYTVRTRLEIDRAHTRATLFSEGKRVWSARIGIGAPGTPTPRGRFYIREVLRGFGKRTIYGPLAFGTSAYSRQLTDWPGGGVIGIHGTNQPRLIPGRPSHGCIRVRNRPIRRLAKLMPLGTPVVIR